ncbi:MAG TPA: hypothetical protein VH558_05825 [Pseudolabrys sp.]
MQSAVRNCVIVVEKEIHLVIAFSHGIDRGRYDAAWGNQLGFGEQIDGRLRKLRCCAMKRFGDLVSKGARLVVVLIDVEPGDDRLGAA